MPSHAKGQTYYIPHRTQVQRSYQNNVLAVLEGKLVGYVFVNNLLGSGLRSFCPRAIAKPPAVVGLFSRRKP